MNIGLPSYRMEEIMNKESVPEWMVGIILRAGRWTVGELFERSPMII
jgi:hypothetical protein